MKNCKHNTFHSDCCVCWFKQSVGDYYGNDVILFMDKMAALLMNKDWRTYCLDRALKVAKNKFEKHASLGLDKLLASAKAVDETKSTAQKVLKMRRYAGSGWVI